MCFISPASFEGLTALLAYIRLTLRHCASAESSTPRNTFTITAAATSRLPTCARRDPPLYIIAHTSTYAIAKHFDILVKFKRVSFLGQRTRFWNYLTNFMQLRYTTEIQL